MTQPPCSSIASTRCLLADMTALWAKISKKDLQLERMWVYFINMLKDEYTMRWNRALALREEFESLLEKATDLTTPETVVFDGSLQNAYLEVEKSFELAQPGVTRRRHSCLRDIRDKISTSVGSRQKGPSQSYNLLDTINLAYRHNLSNLYCVRRLFVEEARSSIPSLIEAQHDIFVLLQASTQRFICSQVEQAATASVRCSRFETLLHERVSPLRLSANLNHSFQLEIAETLYCPRPYIDPSSGERRKMLFGNSLANENDLDLTILHTIVKASREGASFAQKDTNPNIKDPVRFLESNWLTNANDNAALVRQLSYKTRDALLETYLRGLPEPLLPITEQDFAAFGLRHRRLKTILSTVARSNLYLLRDLCEYVERLSGHNTGARRRYGLLVLRLGNGEFRCDNTIEIMVEDLMYVMIRYFRTERETDSLVSRVCATPRTGTSVI